MFGMVCLLVLGVVLIVFGVVAIGLVMAGDVFKYEGIWGVIAFFSCIGGLILVIYEIINIINFLISSGASGA